ncbi:hypothetical protein K438DRAFT_1804666 [Mycena galopus ATCC 62051]|nr:hypothetical protein K438DRAFT_1804666 [Mycena galopus ATCC 62051]
MSAQARPTTIFSLPNELLAAIAAVGQDDRVTDSWQTPSRTFKSEWTLSHVSHRFRDVMVGAPALWTFAEADVDDDRSVEILKLYLERSRACIISTILRESPASNFRDVDEPLPTQVGRLVQHVNRIWMLRIALRTKWVVEMLSRFRDVAAPHLQRLEIVQNDGRPGETIAMLSAPRLTAQWTASLTHLELRSIPAAITAQCPLLVRLYLDLAETTSTQTTRFHIPTLKFLHISIA